MKQKLFFLAYLLGLVYSCVYAQKNALPSRLSEYNQAVEAAMLSGKYEGHSCISPSVTDESSNKTLACVITQGYGTNGWTPASSPGTSNADPLCAVSAVPFPACNGGRYQVPLRIVIFEDASWSGTNYLGGSGFSALSDVDIDNKIAALNAAYAPANIEFYEARTRLRLNNPDMYDFSTYNLAGDVAGGGNNGINDDTESQMHDSLTLVNLYFVGGFDGDHDCCGTMGYAPIGSSVRNYSIMRYGAAVGGTTLEHELGHYLGLFHTQRVDATGNDATGTPDGALNNSDCLTRGDRICDTWPDPNFSNTTCGGCGGVDPYCYISDVFPRCDFDNAGYLCVNGSSLTINPNNGTTINSTTSTVLKQNIMSYNLYGGCRTHFSPCQFKKMQDVVTNCRIDLCDNATTRYFSTPSDAIQTMCVGSATVPTFTARSGNCYNWHSASSGGTTFSSSSQTFTPSIGTGAGQVNTAVPGNYSVYISASNDFNPSCRGQVIVSVLPAAGDNSTGASCQTIGGDGNNIGLSLTGTNLGTDQVSGWWFTTIDPISTTTNKTTLQSTLSSATVFASSPTFSAGGNVVFGAAGNTSVTVNCTSLNEGTNYYFTPFVSGEKAAIPASTCSVPLTVVNSSISGNPAKRGTVTAAALSGSACNVNTYSSYSIVVNSSNSGAANLSYSIRTENSVVTLLNGTHPAPNGTITITKAMLGNYDPIIGSGGNTGFRVIVYSSDFNTASAFTANVVYSYNAVPAINFPDISAYPQTVPSSGCIFGTPKCIVCMSGLPVSWASFSAEYVNEATHLYWTTSTEKNAKIFYIERSLDRQNFEVIGNVSAFGNSQNPISYSFKDYDANTLNANRLYYRINQVDETGLSSYSKIEEVLLKGNPEIKVYPNPAENKVYIDFSTLRTNASYLSLYDATGRQVITTTNISSNIMELELESLPSGIYWIRVDGGGLFFSTKLVKQ